MGNPVTKSYPALYTVNLDSNRILASKKALFVGKATMSSIAISLITFGIVFGGAILGIAIRAVLPENHLSDESRDVVKLGVGLIATMAALVLGLLIASAKSSLETQNSELTDVSSRIVLLDRVLAHYGPETKAARDQLHSSVVLALDLVSAREIDDQSRPGSFTNGEAMYDEIQALSPKDDAQRSIQGQALSIATGLLQTHWLIAEQRVNSVSLPLLVVLIFWLSIIFIGFGLFAPRNGTVVVSLFVSALSVSAAIFLILEMYSPYGGLIRVSSAPLRSALAHLGQ